MLGMRSRRGTGGSDRGAGSRARTASACRSAVCLALPLALLLTALGPASAQSATESPTAAEVRAAQVALTLEEREKNAAQKKAEVEAIRAARRAERAELRARERARREAASGTRTTSFGHVVITCSSVTWVYEHFPADASNTVTEIVYIDGTRLPPVDFTFTGSSGSNTVAIIPPAGTHRIDARAKWTTGATRGGWDIVSSRKCGTVTGPAFSIEKRQTIDGTHSGYTKDTLTGAVGQTVDYEIVVTNTGSVDMALSEFSDPHCDPGTITAPPGHVLEPGVATRYFCTHLLTSADLTALAYTNTASITGTPQMFGGPGPITTPSNTVVVVLSQAPPPPPPPSPVPTTTPPSTPTGAVGVLAFSGSQAPRLEALASTTSAPGLSGRPEGCVRSTFTVSVKAKGIRSVTFYLDGHRLKTLAAKSARKGRLSLRINPAHLKVGVHRLSAKITMAPTIASAKAVTVTRSLKFARCAASTVSPKFTG
jgi:hypothetical protein